MDAPPQELQDPRELDYAELAAEVPEPPPDAQEPPVEPVKRKRGRPLGSRNKPKPPPEEPDPEPPASRDVPEPDPEPEDSEPSEPATPIKPKPRASARKPRQQAIPVLDVDFQPGYGGAGPPTKPVRMRRQPTASTLMELIAGAAAQRGEQERDRRRSFYDNHLPS